MNATRIPFAPLLLGLSGLIPFLWGAVTVLGPDILTGGVAAVFPFQGRELLTLYGITILAFMSGTIWGFATRSPVPASSWGYALSVVPALWGFFALALPDRMACAALALGFGALLALDFRAIRLAEAPPWWQRLRLILTTVVVASLLVGTLA